MDRAAEKDAHYYLYAAQLCCKHILSVACQLQRFCMHCLKVFKSLNWKIVQAGICFTGSQVSFHYLYNISSILCQYFSCHCMKRPKVHVMHLNDWILRCAGRGVLEFIQG